MKKITLLFTVLLSISYANAQDRFIRSDATIGSAFTTGTVSSYGISAGVEPKFFFNENVSLGLRFEGAVLFGGKIPFESSDVSVQMSSRAATLLKGEYYLGSGNTKPFLGLMTGYYVTANSGGGTSGASASGARNFGFAPELGITFGNFRISGMYHVVGGNYLVSVSSGETKKISNSYFVVTLGFKAFQIDLD